MSMASDETSSPSELLASARRGDQRAFELLGERHRREVYLHCYRMLGSLHDAEDVVQETFLRAWRSIRGFEGRASFRAWLYRIATNTCLNALASRGRSRRILPYDRAPPADAMPQGSPASDVDWLEPWPDSLQETVEDEAAAPDVRYEMREAIRLAFIAAIQHLPPRQRAVLLLRDVMGWSARESAALLDTSVASVNGALQRARATMRGRYTRAEPTISGTITDEQYALLDRYRRSWENADVSAFVELLQEDAVITMPPWPQWYAGREAIGRFFSWTFRPEGHAPFRLKRITANAQPAFAFYGQWPDQEWRAHSIQVITLDGNTISAMTSFVSPELFPAFGLPPRLAP